MNMQEAGAWLQQQLQEIYSGSESRIMAAWVLEKVTGQPRIDRLTQRKQPLTAEQQHQLTAMMQRLLQHEPVQYVLGEAHFYGMHLFVDRDVLIPRPETEELVEWIVKDVRARENDAGKKNPGEADKTKTLKILDVGTGSGCIALALKKELPGAEVWGCDKSDAALNIARRNGAVLDIRLDFQAVDFLDATQWNSLPEVDVLVSNPPYIPLNDEESLEPNVRQHEPHIALFVPDENPLLFYEALAQFGKKNLRLGGAVYAEIHEKQGEAVVQLFQNAMYASVLLKKDMQGNNRMVKAIIQE
jgi:release factor glutamine methyltransferase